MRTESGIIEPAAAAAGFVFVPMARSPAKGCAIVTGICDLCHRNPLSIELSRSN
jgi:hypothetical protein